MLILIGILTTRQSIYAQHFQPVWTGNPYKPMNIVIQQTTIGFTTSVNIQTGEEEIVGINMTPGDEVGFFDVDSAGVEYCVGVGIVNGVVSDLNPLIVILSQGTGGSQTNGYILGNDIIVKQWDHVVQEEVMIVISQWDSLLDTVYTSWGTAVVNPITGYSNPVAVGINNNTTYCCNNVVVPITIDDCINVTQFSLFLEYDTTLIDFEGSQNLNSLFSTDDFDVTEVNGNINLEYNGLPVSLLDEQLIELEFLTQYNICSMQSTDLNWNDQISFSLLYSGDSIDLLMTDDSITIRPLPTIFAGADDTIHVDSVYMTSATVTNYESVLWSTSGDGNFNDSTTLDAIYIPGVADAEAGTTNLILSATFNDSCITTVFDTITLFIASTQQIVVQTGWNIISFNKIPDNYDMISILQCLIDSNNFIKLIDEAGNIVQFIPGVGWLNTISNMENTEGYYLKANYDSQITLTGIPIILPYQIPLQTGWNILGYPVQTPQDAIVALQPLVDSSSLVKVIDEAGGFIQDIPGLGWINTIGNFEPGEGYYIKLNTLDTLILNESTSKASSHQSLMQEGHYYRRNNNGNPYLPMHIVANFDDNIELTEGDELGVFINNLCIGSAYIDDTLSPITAYLATDDHTTEAIDGGVEGENMNFKLLHKGREHILHCQSENADEILFEPLETRFITFYSNGLGNTETETNSFFVSEVMPNPFIQIARVNINIPEEGHLKASLKGINGISYGNIIDGLQPAGNLNLSVKRNNLPPGIYTLVVEYVNELYTRKVTRKLVIQ